MPWSRRGLAHPEEDAAVDRLAHDPLHQVHAVALAPEAHAALGAAGHRRAVGRGDRPGAAVEAVEGEPAEVGGARRRSLAFERLDPEREGGVLADAAQIAELDALREAGAREQRRDAGAGDHARAQARERDEERQREHHRERGRDQRHPQQAGRDGARHLARVARLDRLAAQRVHQQRPDRGAHEGDQQRREEHAVGEVGGQHHLEERERDQQELGVARARVQELEALREGREVRERDRRGIAAQGDRDRRGGDPGHPEVEREAALLPGMGIAAAQQRSDQRRDLEQLGPERHLLRDPERGAGDGDEHPGGGRPRGVHARAEGSAGHAASAGVGVPGCTRARKASSTARWRSPRPGSTCA